MLPVDEGQTRRGARARAPRLLHRPAGAGGEDRRGLGVLRGDVRRRRWRRRRAGDWGLRGHAERLRGLRGRGEGAAGGRASPGAGAGGGRGHLRVPVQLLRRRRDVGEGGGAEEADEGQGPAETARLQLDRQMQRKHGTSEDCDSLSVGGVEEGSYFCPARARVDLIELPGVLGFSVHGFGRAQLLAAPPFGLSDFLTVWTDEGAVWVPHAGAAQGRPIRSDGWRWSVGEGKTAGRSGGAGGSISV